MTYQFGQSNGRLRPSELVGIRHADQAAQIRERAAHVRLLASESAELRAAHQELALAKAEARRAEHELLSFGERLELAEQVRAAAFDRYGYDPVSCERRLMLATNERTQGLWVSQKKRRNQK